MKNILLALLFLSISQLAFVQTVQKFYDWRWKETDVAHARFIATIEKTDSGYARNDYYLREKTLQMRGLYEDEDCKIETGRFMYFHPNGRLLKSGSFKHGKKEGVWMSFYNDGKMLDSLTFLNGNKTGICLAWHQNLYPSDSMSFRPDGSGVHVSWFDNGNPSSAGLYEKDYIMNGKWQYWHKNGEVSCIETYTHGKLANKEYFDEKGIKMGDTTNHDRPAVYKGKSGKSSWLLYLEKNTYYPIGVRISNADQAVVVVDGVISEEGKVVAAELSTAFFPQFDKIAIGVILKSPDWLPAVDHNRRVKYFFRQPIVFSNGE